MSSPRALTLYRTFPAEVQKKFRRFIESPYFNTRLKLQKLLHFFDTLAAGDLTWRPAEAAAFVLGDKSQIKALNNLLSDMNRLLENFIAVETMQQDTEWKDAALAKGLEQLGAPVFTQAVLKRKSRRGTDDPFALFHLHKLTDQLHFSSSRQNSNDALLESQKQLTIYYLTWQLKTWCELLNRSHILALDYEKDAVEIFRQILASASELVASQAVTKLYDAIFQWMLDQEDDTWYTQISGSLFDTLLLTDKDDAKEICAYIQNYCVKRINEGNPAFLQELFRLFQFMIQQKLILEGQQISQWTYKNIVTVGLRLKAFSETESFIHEWYTYLPDEVRDNAYHYNLAAFYYETHHYTKASKLLNRVQFTDPVYYLDSYTILMKIYFEEAAGEALASLKDTVRIYLLRQKNVSRQQVQLYNNLFRLTLRLFHLRYTAAHLSVEEWQKRRERLQEEIHRNNNIANKAWLLQQLDMLINRASG